MRNKIYRNYVYVEKKYICICNEIDTLFYVSFIKYCTSRNYGWQFNNKCKQKEFRLAPTACVLAKGPKSRREHWNIYGSLIWISLPQGWGIENIRSANGHRQNSEEVRPIGFFFTWKQLIEVRRRSKKKKYILRLGARAWLLEHYRFAPPPISFFFCSSSQCSSFSLEQKSIWDHPFNIKSGRCLYTQQSQFAIKVLMSFMPFVSD